MPPSPDFRPSRRHAELGLVFFDVVEPASFPLHRPLQAKLARIAAMRRA